MKTCPRCHAQHYEIYGSWCGRCRQVDAPVYIPYWVFREGDTVRVALPPGKP